MAARRPRRHSGGRDLRAARTTWPDWTCENDGVALRPAWLLARPLGSPAGPLPTGAGRRPCVALSDVAVAIGPRRRAGRDSPQRDGHDLPRRAGRDRGRRDARDPPRRADRDGVEHLLAVLAAKILPRLLAGLDVGLGEFLAHVGVVVFHALTVIHVVLPLPAIDVVDVDGSVGHDIDIAAAPVAVAPEGVRMATAAVNAMPVASAPPAK